MKSILFLLIVFNGFSSLVLSSDEIVLKSGEKIAGTVDLTQETQEKIVLRIRGEDGITVEKDIPKQDIVEIIWDQGMNDPAFALKLGENSQDADWYKRAIVNQLKPWLERYPKSQHVAAMKDKLDAFTAEHLRVQNGDRRMGEKWYPSTADTSVVTNAPPFTTIVTLDGKEYTDIKSINPVSYGLEITTDSGPKTVLCRRLPREIQEKFNLDPFESDLFAARDNTAQVLRINMAYRLSQLDVAIKKAKETGKPLGFIMVWDQFFNTPSRVMDSGGAAALLHFYKVFDPSLVLVFVRHEDELNQVPAPVKEGFFGPDEGGFAPNLCVVDSECKKYICEIPLGGGRDSNGQKREVVFRQKMLLIKDYLKKNRVGLVTP